MKTWRIGTNWGGDFIFPLFRKHNIAFAGLEVEEQIKKVRSGDTLAITDGQTIIAVAKVKGIGRLRNVQASYAKTYDDVSCIILDKIFTGVDYPYLEFGIYDGRGKQFHQAHGDYELTINNTLNILESMSKENPYLDVIKYKKQVILQGPPGTGKTRLAKKLASLLTTPETITVADIKKHLQPGTIIQSASVKASYSISELQPKHVEYYRHGSDTYARVNYTDIIRAYEDKIWITNSIRNGSDSYSAAFAKYIHEHFQSENTQLVQFHPSFSYDDFIRGIVAIPNPSGEGILYEGQNKILAEMAERALSNYKLSTEPKSSSVTNHQNLSRFVDHIIEQIDCEDGKYHLTENVYIFYVDDKRLKYKGDNWTAHNNGLNMNFSEIEKILDLGLIERADIKKNPELRSPTRQHSTYFTKFIEKFRAFVNDHPDNTKNNLIQIQNFVLIIDEINRANLSAVLGELIYALEYRGSTVKGLHYVDDNNDLIIPPNLYIIGTMNTADRSVGRLDYAVRRRFAFIDIGPVDLSSEVGDLFDSSMYSKVSKIFNSENVSQEFEIKDIQLGHSCFILDPSRGATMDMRLEYEIKPILLEYVRDGVLIGKIEDKNIKDYVTELA